MTVDEANRRFLRSFSKIYGIPENDIAKGFSPLILEMYHSCHEKTARDYAGEDYKSALNVLKYVPLDFALGNLRKEEAKGMLEKYASQALESETDGNSREFLQAVAGHACEYLDIACVEFGSVITVEDRRSSVKT